MLPWVVFIFIGIQLLVVAYIDFKSRTISNVWSVINFIFFLVLLLVFPKLYDFSFKSFFFTFAFLFVGFVLYLLNIMGGGDSKYLSSIYLLIPVGLQELVFTYLLYSTVLVGSSLLLYNLLKNFDKIIYFLSVKDISGIKRIFGKKFTYAPVIFISWMWFGWKNFELLTV